MRKREIDGEITDGEGAVFKKPLLNTWFTKPRMAPPATIANNCIYVAVDPNGGANKTNTPGSDTAIVSFFITNGCVVVSEFLYFGCASSGSWEMYSATSDVIQT